MDNLLGWHIRDEVEPKHCIEVRQVNELFMKCKNPLALFSAAKTLAEGVNAAFTVLSRSLICSHFCNDLPAASSDRAKRRSGVSPIDR